MDFAVPADHRVKQKESEKRDKLLDFARELEKKTQLRIMSVTVIPIVIDALGTVPKGLVRGLEELEIGGRIETILTTVLLKSTRILVETCCHSDSNEILSANAGLRILQEVK